MRLKPTENSSQVLSTRKRTGAQKRRKGRNGTVKGKRPAPWMLTAEDKALRKAHERFFAEAATAGFTWLD